VLEQALGEVAVDRRPAVVVGGRGHAGIVAEASYVVRYCFTNEAQGAVTFLVELIERYYLLTQVTSRRRPVSTS